MKQLVSPKDVAAAIGVSESSTKRWCDRGLLGTVRTGGGHRRLTIAGVLRFIRESGRALVKPEMLGLPADIVTVQSTIQEDCERLRMALVDGDENAARGVILGLFLRKQPISVIGDDVIAQAMHRIGNQWECGDVQIYEERRSCELCLKSLQDIRSTFPSPPDNAPIAIGATPKGDPYAVAVAIAELVLLENGWNATSLGSFVPFDSLAIAIRELRPKILWLSVSYIQQESRFVDECSRLFDIAMESGTALAVGGQALLERIRKRTKYSSFCDTMQHLEQFANTLLLQGKQSDAS